VNEAGLPHVEQVVISGGQGRLSLPLPENA
jgi:hypothetical protein